jgi:ABC-type transport system involved in multi-copper enzyme maturation permease subunit
MTKFLRVWGVTLVVMAGSVMLSGCGVLALGIVAGEYMSRPKTVPLQPAYYIDANGNRVYGSIAVQGY